MKFVVISDTHQQHRKLILPEGDIIIHCGDITTRGYSYEVDDFVEWFSGLPYKSKVFIAGNHDFILETHPEYLDKFKDLFKRRNIHYLNDSSTAIEGIKIHGSPITPWFYDWAFNRFPGDDIIKHWMKIPFDVQILITHGPPAGILDFTKDEKHAGCLSLLHRIHNMPELKFHLFGHIHEGYGRITENRIEFINACSLDRQYRLVNKPVEFEL